MTDKTGKHFELDSATWIRNLYSILPYMLGTYIFLNPFPATSPKEIIYYSMALVFICLAVTLRGQFSFRSPLAIPFVLFAFWGLLSVFFALDPASSLNDYFAHLIKWYVLYYMLVNFFHSSERLEIIAWLIIVSTTIFVLAMGVHWYLILGQPLTSRLGHSYQTYGTVTNGFYTVFGLVLALRQLDFEKLKYRKWILWVSIGLMGAASFFSQARSTLIALLLAVVVFYIRRIKILAGIVLCLVVFVALMPVRDRFTNWDWNLSRLGQFYYTAEIIKDHPLLGIGFSVDTFRDDTLIDRESYMTRIPQQYQNPNHQYYWPHNMFFSTAVRTGIPGCVLFALFFAVPTVLGWKLARRGQSDVIRSWGLCCLACLGMFFVKGNLDQAFLSAIEIIFFSILAIITIAWNLHQQMEPAKVGSDTSEKKGAKGAG